MFILRLPVDRVISPNTWTFRTCSNSMDELTLCPTVWLKNKRKLLQCPWIGIVLNNGAIDGDWRGIRDVYLDYVLLLWMGLPVVRVVCAGNNDVLLLNFKSGYRGRFWWKIGDVIYIDNFTCLAHIQLYLHWYMTNLKNRKNSKPLPPPNIFHFKT